VNGVPYSKSVTEQNGDRESDEARNSMRRKGTAVRVHYNLVGLGIGGMMAMVGGMIFLINSAKMKKFANRDYDELLPEEAYEVEFEDNGPRPPAVELESMKYFSTGQK
jgi:hypothetical protein